MSASRGLREAIRTELARSGLALPIARDTEQAPVSSPVQVTRQGNATWLVDYQSSSATLPINDDPAWTAYTTGAATQAITVGVLEIAAAATTDSLFNYIAVPTLDAAKGTYFEAKLKVVSNDAGANKGACMAVWDGVYASVLWLRTDGLNVDGAADVPVTLSDAVHRVGLHVYEDEVTAYVDGVALQTSTPTGSTTLEAVGFGSWIDLTP